MIGNDIVWLDDPANRGRSGDQRLVRRILTAAEAERMAASPDPDRALWGLWAAKEAAHKACSRFVPGGFSPVSWEVVGGDFKQAAVRRGTVSYSVSWLHGPDWIHAVVSPGPVSVCVEPMGEDPSAGVRALAERSLVAAGWPPGQVLGRPPVYRMAGQAGDLIISLSHDGPYGAVVWQGSCHGPTARRAD